MIPFIPYLLYFIFKGTGKTFTGVVLIRMFCSINKEICSKGGKKRVVLFCGPSNKSVDLVTGILPLMFANKIQVKNQQSCFFNLHVLAYFRQTFPIKIYQRPINNCDI